IPGSEFLVRDSSHSYVFAQITRLNIPSFRPQLLDYFDWEEKNGRVRIAIEFLLAVSVKITCQTCTANFRSSHRMLGNSASPVFASLDIDLDDRTFDRFG